MTVVVAIVLVLMGVAALLAVVRVVRGPSILDRMVASEVALIIAMCAMLAEMAYHEHTRTLPVVLVLAVLGFVGPVSVARYVAIHGVGR